MAKPIDLSTPGGATQSVQPVTETARVPAPAVLPAGITSGVPPLPTGQFVTAINPSKLTPLEQRQLEKTGWKAGQHAPDNLQEVLSALQVEAEAELDYVSLPVSPDTPPVVVNPIDVASMSPEEQLRVQREMAAMLGGKMFTDTTTDTTTDTAPDTASEQKPESTISTKPPSAGAAAPLTHCPQCLFDLAMDPITLPDDNEKEAFVHSMLGMKPFMKSYPLFGNQAEITFRTLSSGELDAIYRQAQLEVERNQVTTDADYRERLMRYRLYLQVAEFRTVDLAAREFPDGLSQATNPNATAFWVTESSEPLVEIDTWMCKELFKTESITRVARNQCSQFNRLVARLEALAGNSDFWQKTAAPP